MAGLDRMKPELLKFVLLALGAFALYEIFAASTGQQTTLNPSTSIPPTGAINLGLGLSTFQNVNANASGLYQNPSPALTTVSGDTAAPITPSPGSTILGGDFGL